MGNEMLILSSSPPRQFAAFSLSSSPPLPSMDEIVQKRPQVLRTGSRAAPIPQNASASFTSAAPLLKSASKLNAIHDFALEDDATEESIPTKPSKRAKIVKTRKAPVKKAEDELKPMKKPKRPIASDGDPEVAEKKKSKPRAKKATENSSETLDKGTIAPKPRAKTVAKESTEATKDKPVRKPRAKKADGASQTKLSKGKVTKNSTAVETKLDGPSREGKETKECKELDLPKALKRRADWTPPGPTSTTVGITTSDIDLSSGVLQPGEKRNGFADLFGNYGFTKVESSSAPTPLGTEITRKRKLSDLVKTNVTTAAAASPKLKEKAPKKKPKTLTDQATSAYAEEEELTAQSAPLLQYFPLQNPQKLTHDGFKIPPKPRSKSPVKGNSKVKKGSAQAPILLSPESAMKQVGKQDFVFGTSSQLAREDSPTLLRDLHAAMQASNEEDDPFAESVFDSSPPSIQKRRTGPSAKRNLWSAASRDDSGELLDLPMIDLADSPAVDCQKLELPAVIATPIQAGVDVWHDIGTTPAARAEFSLPKVVGPIEASIRTELLSSPSGCRGTKSPKTSKQAKLDDRPPKMKQPEAKSPARNRKEAGPQMPNFSAYTDAQLAKDIASYRFKPVKKREQMILLLQRCWEGKNQPPPVLSNLSTNLPVVLTKTAKAAPTSTQLTIVSPKRPRGRPRKETTVQYLEMDSDVPLSQARTPKKASKKATQNMEDISDSESPVTPSPPRRSTFQMSPLPLQSALSNSSESPELSPEEAKDLIFKHISSAVTSAPRSKDPLHPNWHEKILLYDPIVLEDLTVWLNTGGLEKVGWDGEVEPKLVKKWCESKSVCCLWRENLRGGARNRY